VSQGKYYIAGIVICLLAILIVLYVTQTKKDYYLIRGKKSYEKHCANCHGSKGEGLQMLIPPLTDPAWTQSDSIVCIIRNGLDGEITVNNKKYSGRMTGNLKIEDDEIADLVSYLRHEIVQKPQKMLVKDVQNGKLLCR
jgi:mono/diheme cytochrome c family protein